MKKTLFSLLLVLSSISGFAEVNPESVLLTIENRPVTAGEFLYAYNKNGNFEGAVEQKTIREYLDMFVNYKLKVAAALEARMDTLTSFNEEFRTYRDMQLYPYLVDSAYIDSVAYSIYDRTKKHLNGKDLLHPAHILIRLQQRATEAEQAAAKATADSVYKVLKAGADFATTAKSVSQDPGSAPNGGMLPWIGPGSTLKEFEDAAYKLQAGEMSEPILSPVGYHIILMRERKAFEPYEQLRAEIIAALKKQGIEDAAAEVTIMRYVDAGTPREEVMTKVIEEQVKNNPSLKYLIQEYHDGLLSYEITNKYVYSAANEEAALTTYFKENKKNYTWDEPRFKGYVFQCKNKEQVKKVRSFLKDADKKDWRKELKEKFNKDSVTVQVTGPYLAKKGENRVVDECVFGGEKAKRSSRYPYVGVSGKKLKKPQSYVDVKSYVTSDLQEKLEKEYIRELRGKYEVVVNDGVLNEILANEK